MTIYSGGQTGADIAGLNFAVRHGLRHGGWCPRGRKAEDGVIAPRFRLRETPSAGYSQRTECNVHDSDGTVIFTIADRHKGGSMKTAKFARKLRKPWLHLAAKRPGVDRAAVLRCFIKQHGIKILNVAGPRKSQEQTIGKFVTNTLRAALTGRVSAKRKPAALVVDDNLDLREIYRALLPGFRVFEAEASEDALRIAKRRRFNLVITDFVRPGSLDGLQFIAAAKKTQPSVRVIMATGSRKRGLRTRALRLGADAFLAKPFQPAALLASVDYALSQPVRKRKVRRLRGTE